MTLDKFKDMARDQFFMLLLDTEATLEATPALMTPVDPALRRKAFNSIKNVLEAGGELTGDALKRLNRVEELFGLRETEARPAFQGEPLRLVSRPAGPVEAAEPSSEKCRNGVSA